MTSLSVQSRTFLPRFAAVLAAGLLFTLSSLAADRHLLRGHVPSTVSGLAPSGRLQPERKLDLIIGLPLRDPEGLHNLLHQIYDPASTNFHAFVTPSEFTRRFGPSQTDYEALVTFVETNGLTVTGTHPGRTMLEVSGRVADVERIFHVALRTYDDPAEARMIYAPDAEPSVDFGLPILHITGLDNSFRSHPRVHGEVLTPKSATLANAGSGPSGEYWGYDFRNVYLPGETLTGSGQTVALFELEGYYANDITSYENKTGLPAVTVQNVPIKSFSFIPNNTDSNGVLEVSLDIEVAIAMAPGLSKVLVYGATNGLNLDQTILQQIADDNSARQISSSWGINVNSNIDQIYLQFAVQGQSFFFAAGDTDAYYGAIPQGADDPYITVVGGTTLTADANTNWQSEVVWNYNNSGLTPTNTGSSGGISTTYPIPQWQARVSMAANQGSTQYRNIPDVSMVADQVATIARNGQSINTYGTSIAAPLWAALTAIANEKMSADGKPPLGFLNPALYALGSGSGYSSVFHDITVGNNTNTVSPNLFRATPGYDLCTGWGTPNGASLINALELYAGAVYVNLLYKGSVQNGAFDTPFPTFSQGVTFVANGGAIVFETGGSVPAAQYLTKSMTISTIGGTVTIGN